MSRRANSSRRCARCRMHQSLCVCALIPRIETRTRLVLVIHRSEDRKSTNSGRLATLCLPNSEVIVRGHEEAPSAPFVWEDDVQPLLLYPFENALPIADFAQSPKRVALVVPDGNWRQASKVRNRVPGLKDVPCVSLPHDAPSVYRLRFEAHEKGLATMEAIARAMGALEGLAVREGLERVFRAMVERTLWARGAIETENVEAGVPEGVMRHDPQSGLGR